MRRSDAEPFSLLYGTDELIAAGTNQKSKYAYIPPNVCFPYFLISSSQPRFVKNKCLSRKYEIIFGD